MPDTTDADHSSRAATPDDPYFAERSSVFKPIMSLAEYDRLAVPPGSIPRTWRQLLAHSVGWIYPNGEMSDAEYLTEFEQGYGPCSTSHLVELAERYADSRMSAASVGDTEGAGGEIMFILLMLGVWPEHPYVDLARDVLLRFLESQELIERMMSAISLSHLRDERAIPALLALLTDGLPEPNYGDVEPYAYVQGKPRFLQASDQLRLFRNEIPAILARWDVRRTVPALRHALDVTVRIERAEAQRDPNWHSDGYWRDYQWALVGAMGWLGAFGALTGIEPPEENFWRKGISIDARTGVRTPLTKGDPKTWLAQVWRVALCLGAMARRYVEAGRHGTIKTEETRPELERLLAEQFGMDEAERTAAVEAFGIFSLDLKLDWYGA